MVTLFPVQHPVDPIRACFPLVSLREVVGKIPIPAFVGPQSLQAIIKTTHHRTIHSGT